MTRIPRKGTWQMSAVDLARVFARHFGWTGRPGGWIYTTDGRPICQGWDNLAEALTSRGWIRVGAGVDWRAAGENPRLTPRLHRGRRGTLVADPYHRAV